MGQFVDHFGDVLEVTDEPRWGLVGPDGLIPLSLRAIRERVREALDEDDNAV